MDEEKEDLIDLWYELKRNPGLGKSIFFQIKFLNALFSNPKRFIKKLGPFLFVHLVIIATIVVIFIILTPHR